MIEVADSEGRSLVLASFLNNLFDSSSLFWQAALFSFVVGIL